MHNRISFSASSSQNGAALITALIMLVILTLLGLSSISTATMEERMAANAQEINRAFQAASTGLEIVFSDETAFDTSLTIASDGTANDKYIKSDTTIGGTGTYAYNANASYNSVFRQMTVPPRGSGWDSSYGYYHFQLSSTGSTDSGASSTVNAGAYQIGKAQ
jgi:type IV pilus assembly protein PilX